MKSSELLIMTCELHVQAIQLHSHNAMIAPWYSDISDLHVIYMCIGITDYYYDSNMHAFSPYAFSEQGTLQ